MSVKPDMLSHCFHSSQPPLPSRLQHHHMEWKWWSTRWDLQSCPGTHVTGSHDVFMPPRKRAEDLTWPSCGIVQPFDIVGCHLILGNCEWVLALKQTGFVCFVCNWLPTYLAHTDVKYKIPLIKNRARSGPEEAGICCLNCTIFPFSTFPGPFKQCFGSSPPCPGAVSLVCVCVCLFSSVFYFCTYF